MERCCGLAPQAECPMGNVWGLLSEVCEIDPVEAAELQQAYAEWNDMTNT